MPHIVIGLCYLAEVLTKQLRHVLRLGWLRGLERFLPWLIAAVYLGIGMIDVFSAGAPPAEHIAPPLVQLVLLAGSIA